jgi:hypothetical protein
MGLSAQRHAPAVLNPRERSPGTHWIVGWVSLRAGLDTEAREKIICLCRRSNLCRPVYSHTPYWQWVSSAVELTVWGRPPFEKLIVWRWQPFGIYRRVVSSADVSEVGTHLWNIGILQRDYMAVYSRRLPYSYSPPWKPEISQASSSSAGQEDPATEPYLNSLSAVCSVKSYLSKIRFNIIFRTMRMFSTWPSPSVFSTKFHIHVSSLPLVLHVLHEGLLYPLIW